MEIVYLGKNNFKLKVKRGVVSYESGSIVTLTGASAKVPFIITQPGEYEVEGLSVFGYPGEGIVTYVFQLDEIRVMTIEGKVEDKLVDELDTIDVVIVNTDLIGAKELVAMLGKIEPSYVLPYGESERVAGFVKEFEHGSKEQDKLVLVKATISEDLTEVIVLK